MNGLYRAGRAMLAFFLHILHPYRIVHPQPEPEGRCICCANHISLKDPFFLAFTRRRQIFYMAKAELFHTKVFGTILKLVGAFPVHRGRGDSSALRTADSILMRGDVLGIFPEGTRSKTGALLNGKPGVVMLAYQHHAPIYPTAIVSRSAHPRLFRRVLIVCGKPIQPEELNIRQGTSLEYRAATRLIMSRIAALQAEGKQLLGCTEASVAESAAGGEHLS